MCPLQIFWVKLLLLSGVFFWWGKVGGGLGCWRMVVVGSWGPSFKRWIAWQRHGNHWRVIRTDLLKFNLFLKILWAAYFDWHGKKPPKPKPNHPKLDWNQPPKIHPKKTNQPYPQTEATFPSIFNHLIFVRSTRWSPWMNHSSRRRPRRFALRTLPLGRNVGTAVEGGSFLVGEVTEQLVDWLVDLLMLVCLILLK